MRRKCIPREELAKSTFLADRKPQTPEDEAWLPLDDVLAMQPETGKLHFVFHTAFCRSTLLVRALDMPGVSAGLSEPGIIAALVNAGEEGKALVKPVLDLLSRPQGPGEAVFLKPTNHANMLIPDMLGARRDAKAVLLTCGLAPFLRSVLRRGLLGRRWGRQLYLEMMSYAGMDLGLDAREQFSMTDMQAAGLAWLLAQRWFKALLGGGGGDRLRVLDGDCFNAERARTLEAIADLAGLDLPRGRAEEVAGGPLFGEHAKLGGEFPSNEDDKAPAPILEEEIAQVGQWIGMIAEQARLQVPLKQTLF
jgi:hypothetical protein